MISGICTKCRAFRHDLFVMSGSGENVCSNCCHIHPEKLISTLDRGIDSMKELLAVVDSIVGEDTTFLSHPQGRPILMFQKQIRAMVERCEVFIDGETAKAVTVDITSFVPPKEISMKHFPANRDAVISLPVKSNR